MSKTNYAVLTGHPGSDSIEKGTVLVPSTTKEGWASIRLEQVSFEVNGGIVNKKVRSAIIRNEEQIVRDYMEYLGVSKEGDKVEGRIQLKEQTEPFYEGQEPKRAGKDGEVLVDENDNEIYRQGFFIPQEQYNPELHKDVLVQHVNEIEYTAQSSNVDSGAVKQ